MSKLVPRYDTRGGLIASDDGTVVLAEDAAILEAVVEAAKAVRGSTYCYEIVNDVAGGDGHYCPCGACCDARAFDAALAKLGGERE
jgi:hypothetical protein